MRITFISPTVSLSGGIKVIAIYAEALQRKGHSVVVVAPSERAPRLRSEMRRVLSGKPPSVFNRRQASYFDGHNVDLRMVAGTEVNNDDVPDADIVIATWWQTAEWVNGFSENKGTKVYFIQGFEVFPGQPEERVLATWRSKLHKVTISKWLEKKAREEFGDPSVIRVPNGVDLEQFHCPPRAKQHTPTVGFLYAPSTVKGIDVALETLKRLRERMGGRLHVVSFGAHAPEEAYPLPAGTDFAFRPPQNEIKNVFAKCDVWLVPSRSEGFHLPPLEAMACRVPVVATRVGGPQDIVEDGQNGYLVDIEDIDGLVLHLEKVLSLDSAEWQKMSLAAYRTALDYSWDKAADRFETAILQCHSRNKA